MLRKVLALTVIVLVFATSHLKAEQISCSWGGCEDGLWGDPSNWDCGLVPDNNETDTFVVIIDARGCPDEVEVGLRQSRTINRLDTYGEVQLDVPDWEDDPSCSTIMFTVLDPTNGITNYGMFEVDQERHRVIEINGDVTNTAGAEISLSETNINGNFYNESNAVVNIGYKCEIDGNFENAGTMNLWGPDVILWIEDTLHNVNQINLVSGDCGANRIINGSNGVIQGYGDLSVENEGELLQNKGAIYASSGSLVVLTEVSHLLNTGVLGNKPASFLHVRPGYPGTAKDVNNHGTIEVNAGGGVAFDCNLVNDPNGAIKLLGGTLAATTITQVANANFAGFGTITGDVLIEPHGLIQLTGPTNIVGDVNIPTGAMLEISDGQTLITGHTTCDGTIHLIGGTVVFQGGCDCEDCNIINEAGLDRNHFDINADGIEDFRDFAVFANSWLWQATWY